MATLNPAIEMKGFPGTDEHFPKPKTAIGKPISLENKFIRSRRCEELGPDLQHRGGFIKPRRERDLLFQDDVLGKTAFSVDISDIGSNIIKSVRVDNGSRSMQLADGLFGCGQKNTVAVGGIEQPQSQDVTAQFQPARHLEMDDV